MRVLVVVLGGVVLLAVVAVSLSSCAADTHDMEILTFLVVMVGGLVRLLAAGKESHAVRANPPSGPDSVRLGPPDPRPQLAGSTCAQCEQKIMLEIEAVLCKTCERPLHRECRKQHRVDAHRPVSGQAYR
jgi:hypothetical protein